MSLEGYLDDLVEGGQIEQEQADGTMEFVENKQKAVEKRIEKFAEEEDE